MRRLRLMTMCLTALVALALVPSVAAAAPRTIVDNFAAGTPDANTVVTGGSVQLQPTDLIDQPSFAALPTGWTSTPWSGGGGVTFASGNMLVDGTLVGPDATFSAPHTITWRATFTADPFEHVGIGTDYNNPPWAMFSTGGGALPVGLYTRTNIGGTVVDNPVVGVDPLVAHNYEIRWLPDQVVFVIDGTVVDTQNVTVPSGQRALASDFNVGGGAVTVSSLTVSSYPTSGTFTSQVFDGGPGLNSWTSLTPEGTLAGVTIETRTAPAAGGPWSDWAPLGAGGSIASPTNRYLQYRATLTGNGLTTPSLDRVTIAYDVDVTAPTVTISGVTVRGTTATATFSSPDTDVARFECSLDGGAFSPCTSPKAYTDLRPGSHRFSVRAVDNAGNVGTAVSQAFTVPEPPKPPKPKPKPDHVKPRVKPTPRTVRASGRYRVTFRVKCPRNEKSCKLSLRLKSGKRIIASSGTVNARRGQTVHLTLALNRYARNYLRTHRRMRPFAITTARDAAGNVGRTTVRVTVLAPRVKHKPKPTAEPRFTG